MDIRGCNGAYREAPVGLSMISPLDFIRPNNSFASLILMPNVSAIWSWVGSPASSRRR